MSHTCSNLHKVNLGEKINEVIRLYNENWIKTQIIKIEKYLYFTEYDFLDYDYAEEFFNRRNSRINLNANCTAVKNQEFYGRNLDFTYDELVEFIVKTKARNNRHAVLGISGALPGLTDDFVNSKSDSNLYSIVPFMMLDGINDCGLVVNTNVVPTDKGEIRPTIPDENKTRILCSLMLPRFILDNFQNATEAAFYIKNHVSVYISPASLEMGYSTHLMISDINKTYVLEFINGRTNVIDITEHPYITNFYIKGVHFNSDGTVYTPETQDGKYNAVDFNHITPLGSGLERYNYIVSNYSESKTLTGMQDLMKNLFYTNSYKKSTDPFWYTEFVGNNGLKTNSSPEEYTTTINKAINIFENRSRDPESPYYGTWQTTHSVVYDMINKKMYLSIQEGNQNYEYSL